MPSKTNLSKPSFGGNPNGEDPSKPGPKPKDDSGDMRLVVNEAVALLQRLKDLQRMMGSAISELEARLVTIDVEQHYIDEVEMAHINMKFDRNSDF